MTNNNFYIRTDKLTDYEKQNNSVSYAHIIERYVDDMVLCNNIIEADYSVYDNMSVNAYDEETDEYTEIYQWFICSALDEYDIKALNHFGVITSYSNLLDCDVICVNHWGTSWDYVLTEAIPTEDYDICYRPWMD